MATNQQRALYLSAIAGEGEYEEFIAQGIASVIASAPMNPEEALKWTASILSRVFDLVNNDQEKIWPELMPGPPIARSDSDDHWAYEIIWWDNETRVANHLDTAESPLNLVASWNKMDVPFTNMTMKHLADGEVTLWTREAADAVLKLNSAVEALEKIGVNDADFDDLYQEIYEDAIARGNLVKDTRDV